MSTLALGRAKFETELEVRPDDIDMNQHVHASRYLDYVLAARYDQMARCYRLPMVEFVRLGFGWYVRTAHFDYKRPLGMGDRFMVRTWVEAIETSEVRVDFEILRKSNGKLCTSGYCYYTLVRLENGRAAPIPSWAVEKYSI